MVVGSVSVAFSIGWLFSGMISFSPDCLNERAWTSCSMRPLLGRDVFDRVTLPFPRR